MNPRSVTRTSPPGATFASQMGLGGHTVQMDHAHSPWGGLEPPEVIRRYQDAHDRRDTEAALATFTPDAKVEDDGRVYEGTDAIRTWLDTAASEFTSTRALVEAELVGADTWEIVNHVEGDFPGGVVDLRYRFLLEGGLIADLLIAP